MRKLALNLDKLQVETFSAGDVPARSGTVHAHLGETDPKVCPRSANWWCSVGDRCALTTDPAGCVEWM